ncbi:hypothetical protein scyTo_0003890 [Scyliorhinus torazame]|uniref:Synaptotagmin-like protein 1 n=1 Tax=Scyliorhinus torazame TaxID=75743 RepID=A0A401PNW3_SCYTO|nr:hypothetical protein [Scyliorhinus torazame]
MELDFNVEELVDLRFLTDEELEVIVHVLYRDTELRLLEDQRIKKLRQSVLDPKQLKIATGDWFKEVRAKRHSDKTFGSDIVRASIRKKKRTKGERQKKVTINNKEVIINEQEDQELDQQDNVDCTITSRLQNDDEIDGDTFSQHNDESSVPTKDMDANSSLSSFQSPTFSGSMMSLYSNADFGCIDVSGSITFSLYYDENSLEFNINVVQCDDLAEAKKNRSDPYVKSYLLPDKSSRSKRKTSVKKKTLNPTFNEWLKYKLEKDELQSRTLNLSVWHSDHFGRNLFLGEVEIPLETWDWSNIKPTSYILHPRIAAPSNMIRSNSQLYLSVKFIPAGTQGQGLPPTTELHIHLREARNLVPIRCKGINSFVKCYILPDVTKASRQKTRVIKKDLNPVYNHTMVYDGFQTQDMNETCAEITVWDHDTFSNQLLGGLRLSLGTGLSYGLPVNWMDSNEEEVSAWRRMLSEPGQWVDSTLPLRPNMNSMQ